MSVSSLLLSGATIVSFLASVGSASTKYTLVKEHSGKTFFDGFWFNTAPDLTKGFVNYVGHEEALDTGLISVGSDGTAYLGVDSITVLNPGGTGRKSVRIETSNTYTHGLFLLDVTHMPGGVCGTWPAWWAYGPNWPVGGSMDIIEGVNTQATNLMSLQTAPDCTIAGNFQTGHLQTSNCDVAATSGVGCGSAAISTNSYGTGFNSIKGGVYATEWTGDYIRTWFFPRSSIPSDITAGKPEPSLWGTPNSNFQGSCDVDDHFYDNTFVLNTDFCGEWAGSVWNQNEVCKSKAPTCNDFVALNPAAFNDMFWAIKSIKIYQLPGDIKTSSASTTTHSTTASYTSSTSSSLATTTHSTTTSYTSSTSSSLATTTSSSTTSHSTTSSSYSQVTSSSTSHSSAHTASGTTTSSNSTSYSQTPSHSTQSNTGSYSSTSTSSVTPSSIYSEYPPLPPYSSHGSTTRLSTISSQVLESTSSSCTITSATPLYSLVPVKTSLAPYTTVVVTQYVDVCPEGTLSTYTTSQTQIRYSLPGVTETASPSVSMVTSTTVLSSGQTVTLTVPYVYPTVTAPITSYTGKVGNVAASAGVPVTIPYSTLKYVYSNTTATAMGTGVPVKTTEGVKATTSPLTANGASASARFSMAALLCVFGAIMIL